MNKPTSLVVCGGRGCGPKFAGLFTEAQKRKKYDGQRRCIVCVRKESAEGNRRNGRAK